MKRLTPDQHEFAIAQIATRSQELLSPFGLFSQPDTDLAILNIYDDEAFTGDPLYYLAPAIGADEDISPELDRYFIAFQIYQVIGDDDRKISGSLEFPAAIRGVQRHHFMARAADAFETLAYDANIGENPNLDIA